MADWSRYGFKFRPIIPLEDYKHKLIGLQKELEDYISEITQQAQQGRRRGRVYRQIWGSGKSVFLYNVADRLNREMFLGHNMEAQTDTKYDHILAMFFPQPVKENTLMEETVRTGFAQVEASGPPHPTELFLHLLSFIILRRSLLEVKTNLAKSLTDMLGDVSKTIRVQESIERLGSKAREPAAELARTFLEKALGPVRTKDRVLVIENLPALMSRIDTKEFSDAYSSLMSSKNKALLNFEIFNTICRESKLFLFVVFDQMEEYRASNMTVLNRIVTDQQYRNVHVSIVERSDIAEMLPRKLRETYETIRQRLALRVLPIQDPAGFQEMLASYLDEFRDGSPVLSRKFPFRDDAVEYLRQRSQSNPRRFLSCVNEVLPVALELGMGEITEAELKKPKLAGVIASALGTQDGLRTAAKEMQPR